MESVSTEILDSCHYVGIVKNVTRWHINGEPVADSGDEATFSFPARVYHIACLDYIDFSVSLFLSIGLRFDKHAKGPKALAAQNSVQDIITMI